MSFLLLLLRTCNRSVATLASTCSSHVTKIGPVQRNGTTGVGGLLASLSPAGQTRLLSSSTIEYIKRTTASIDEIERVKKESKEAIPELHISQFPSATATVSAATATEKKRLVILGSGWGGFKLARSVDTKKWDVWLVSPRNHFLFTPLLASTAVGTLEYRAIVEPVRSARGVNYVQANCLQVNDVDNELVCQGTYSKEREYGLGMFRMKYDQLVVAVGALPNTFGIEGVYEHTLFLKQVSDAQAIRSRLLECFERAAQPLCSPAKRSQLLHFVVVGGGPTSVELSAEIYDFLREDVTKFYPQLAKDVKITLVEASDHILNSFDESLQRYTLKLFRQRKTIETRLNTSVKKVEHSKLTLSDGSEIPFGACIWSTGIGPTPLVSSLDWDKIGSRLKVDDHLRAMRSGQLLGGGNVFAIGDCATTATTNLIPTAQVADREGTYLAKLFNGKIAESQPFQYKSMGMLAYVGGYKALADTPGIHTKGFNSWLFWRSAYLTRTVSIKNKILIPMFWFKSWLFGRDISRF